MSSYIKPPQSTPTPALTADFFSQLRSALQPDQVIEDLPRRRAYGVDASFYQLVPQVVLRLDTEAEVRRVLMLCWQHRVAVTFRAAGTSLSGQAISDSVLIVLSDAWKQHEVLDDGLRIRLQPGVIGADANRYLQPYQRKIGPDPASINACKIGGIAANNASGMCCGVANNSYHTLDNMVLILADGTRLDSADALSVNAFRQSHKSLLDGLASLASDIRNSPDLLAKIQHKYRLKNTTGYGLNALIDFDDPLDMLLHLMIGSEGTLGFIANITYKTVESHQHKATGLFLFDTARQACQAVAALTDLPVQAVELMDQRALDSVKGKPGLPDAFCGNPLSSTALLVEIQASHCSELSSHISLVDTCLRDFSPSQTIDFSRDPQLIEQLWAIRKGTFPAVGAVRDIGTTVIIEDVAFPIESLAEGVEQLQALFTEYGYDEAIIFGHALAGNLHFVFTQGFEDKNEVLRYDAFMKAVAQMVAVDYKGSLKAEHGTGRNMAPFVALEWGDDGMDVMRMIKALLDPLGILNPGVILNDDPDAHVKHLKALPEANSIIDKCIECGFCEPVCPSRRLSLTPRQRISTWRRIQDLQRMPEFTPEEAEEYRLLTNSFQELGIDTCAATGLCAERCPVGINTGDLIRELRAEQLSGVGNAIARWSAKQFSTAETLARTGLAVSSGISKVIGKTAMQATTRLANKVSTEKVPVWYPEWPKRANSVLTETTTRSLSDEQVVVYFPSCATRVMGASPQQEDQRPQMDVVLSVFYKAGYRVIVPKQREGLCCGMPFNSKGLTDTATEKANELLSELTKLSNNGQYPIVLDTSPCNLRLHEVGHTLQIYDVVDFAANHLLDKVKITPQAAPVALHVTCSSQKMGIDRSLRKLANACAEEVIEPEHIACCGFAGDRGLLKPELNASALSELALQLPDECEEGFSNSRTCEIGLSHHSGRPYQSLLYLLDRVSEPLMAAK